MYSRVYRQQVFGIHFTARSKMRHLQLVAQGMLQGAPRATVPGAVKGMKPGKKRRVKVVVRRIDQKRVHSNLTASSILHPDCLDRRRRGNRDGPIFPVS
jgi:hypothetical protein